MVSDVKGREYIHVYDATRLPPPSLLAIVNRIRITLCETPISIKTRTKHIIILHMIHGYYNISHNIVGHFLMISPRITNARAHAV